MLSRRDRRSTHVARRARSVGPRRVTGSQPDRARPRLYDLLPPPKQQEILVVRTKRNIERATLHSTQDLPDSEVVTANGIRATSPVRTVIDAAGDLPAGRVDAFVDLAVVKRLVTPAALGRRAEELQAPARPGSSSGAGRDRHEPSGARAGHATSGKHACCAVAAGARPSRIRRRTRRGSCRGSPADPRPGVGAAPGMRRVRRVSRRTCVHEHVFDDDRDPAERSGRRRLEGLPHHRDELAVMIHGQPSRQLAPCRASVRFEIAADAAEVLTSNLAPSKSVKVRSRRRRAVPPRNCSSASASSGRARASVSERGIGNHGSSLPRRTGRVGRRVHEREQIGVHVLGWTRCTTGRGSATCACSS